MKSKHRALNRLIKAGILKEEALRPINIGIKEKIINHEIGTELKKIKADIDKITRIIERALEEKGRIEKAMEDIKDKKNLTEEEIDKAGAALDILDDLFSMVWFDGKKERELKSSWEKIKETIKVKIISTYMSEIANRKSSIGYMEDYLHDLTNSTTKIRESPLDSAVRNLSGHFRKKTGKPRNDLIGGLFLLFHLFKESMECSQCKYWQWDGLTKMSIQEICSGHLYKCKKSQDRIKKRIKALNI